MKEKASRKLANGQNIDYSEKENGPRASSAPALGLNTIIFKHVYWYMLQISGERLQDHWSSGLTQAELLTENSETAASEPPENRIPLSPDAEKQEHEKARVFPQSFYLGDQCPTNGGT